MNWNVFDFCLKKLEFAENITFVYAKSSIKLVNSIKAIRHIGNITADKDILLLHLSSFNFMWTKIIRDTVIT